VPAFPFVTPLDFGAPGYDGAVPTRDDEFQRGLIYTVHPRMLAPLKTGMTFRIMVSTRCRVARHETIPSYAPFYQRAKSLLDARLAELACDAESTRPHSWIVSHGWFRMDMDNSALVGAAVTGGVMCPMPGVEPPSGQRVPTEDDLRVPLMTPFAEMAKHPDAWATAWDEFYNEFDFRVSDTGRLVTVSYGEYATAEGTLDFEPIVKRAEHRARCYWACLARTNPEQPFVIAGREWTRIDTGKVTTPSLVNVTTYFEV
jgi:hypothetical protein